LNYHYKSPIKIDYEAFRRFRFEFLVPEEAYYGKQFLIPFSFPKLKIRPLSTFHYEFRTDGHVLTEMLYDENEVVETQMNLRREDMEFFLKKIFSYFQIIDYGHVKSPDIISRVNIRAILDGTKFRYTEHPDFFELKGDVPSSRIYISCFDEGFYTIQFHHPISGYSWHQASQVKMLETFNNLMKKYRLRTLFS